MRIRTVRMDRVSVWEHLFDYAFASFLSKGAAEKRRRARFKSAVRSQRARETVDANHQKTNGNQCDITNCAERKATSWVET